MSFERRSPVQALQATQPVAIYGNTFMISGALSLMQYRRMTDVLNQQHDAFLTVTEAAIRQLRWPTGKPPRTTPTVRVNKTDIVIATPIQRVTGVGQRPAGDAFVKVQKVPHRVVILTPSFDIRATIHLIKEITLKDVPDALHQEFIALTDARITYLPRPEEPPLQAGFINVSARHALLIYEEEGVS